jgi:hypothetical protein
MLTVSGISAVAELKDEWLGGSASQPLRFHGGDAADYEDRADDLEFRGEQSAELK